MKLSVNFRLIFLVVLLGGTLTGCLPATVQTVELPKSSDIRALSLALQSNPTGNVSAQFRVIPYAQDHVSIKIYCTNNNSYPVIVTFPDGVSLDIYGSNGRLVETVKNQSGDQRSDYQVVVQPGESVEIESFTVAKPEDQQRLAYTKFSFALMGEKKTKLQAVTALF